MYITTLNAKISRKLHKNFTNISVKDPDPDPKRSEGRIRIRIRNDPPGRIRIRIRIRNNSLGSATLLEKVKKLSILVYVKTQRGLYH